MPNLLAGSTSPYLLQHAKNPVDWRPWGPEAFQEARRRGVPILLSIGYSTCYWCHVMERESFENAVLARYLSERFVCVKVDREERPDVDDLYMQATLAVRGHGGWPLTAFLEPENLWPFWCGTYLPPEPRGGLPGLRQVAEGVSTAWRERRAEATTQAGEIAGAVVEQLRAIPEARPVGVEQVSEAVSALLRMYDRQHGGFGGAPKFPQPVFLDFLLDVRPKLGDQEASAAVDTALRHTLDRMGVGGVFDQAAGGFHRYSVDAGWTVPHFEKMLYDNALLASVYAKAARCYRDDFYRLIAVRTLDFMLRKLRVDAPEVLAFASALDAEVDHREGKNYLWTLEELRRVLPAEDAAIAAEIYGVSRGTNFQDPHFPQEPAGNVLRMDDRPERLAAGLGLTPEALAAKLEGINARLLAERLTRKQPHRDGKVLAGWNGLAMSAFAAGFTLTGEAKYLEAGLRAAAFVTSEMTSLTGDLLRSWREGKTSGLGFFEDSAFVIRGLLDLAATGDASTKKLTPAAAMLAARAHRQFRDARTGVYYDTLGNQGDLFVRGRSVHDGAIPSATGVHLHNLIDLARLTGEPDYVQEAAELLSTVSGVIGVPGGGVGSINSVRALLRMLTEEGTSALFADTVASAMIAPSAHSETGPAAVGSEVEFYAGVERIEVSPGRPAVLELLVKVAAGYHVVAAEPDKDGAGGWEGLLTPLRVFAVDAGGGPACVEVFADYPEGEAFGVDGQTVRVYRGSVTLKVVVEAEGEWKGKPLLGVEYQACSDTACQKSARVELDVAIDRGA